VLLALLLLAPGAPTLKWLLAPEVAALNRLPQPDDRQVRTLVRQFESALDNLPSDYGVSLRAIIRDPGVMIVQDFVDRATIPTELVALNLVSSQERSLLQIEQRALALGPPHSIFGTNGDLDRALNLLNEASVCTSVAAQIEAQNVLAGYQLHGQPVLVANSFFDVFADLLPPLVPVPGAKEVKIQSSLSARVSGSPTGRACVSGQAPAGATLNVTVNCGGNVQMMMVTADANCRWRACFDLPGPGNCQVTAADANNLANNDQRVIGTC
jgi:hypothetical protein